MTLTRPYLSGAEQRDCRLYRIYGLDPRTGYKTTTLIYIGETGREPFVRFVEHLYEQPFGDTIVGLPQVDPRVFGSKAQVWAAERAAIEAERPLYNYEWNLNNPRRIPIPVAREQRWARDRAAGRPQWQPGERTQQTGGRVSMSQSWRHARARWSRQRIRRATRLSRWALAAAVWLVAFGLVTWRIRVGAAAAHHPVPLRDAAIGGAAVPTAVYLLVASQWPRKRRRRR